MGRYSFNYKIEPAEISLAKPPGTETPKRTDAGSDSEDVSDSSHEDINLVVGSAKPAAKDKAQPEGAESLPRRRLFSESPSPSPDSKSHSTQKGRPSKIWDKLGAKDDGDQLDDVSQILSNMSLGDRIKNKKQATVAETKPSSSSASADEKSGSGSSSSRSSFSSQNIFQGDERRRSSSGIKDPGSREKERTSVTGSQRSSSGSPFDNEPSTDGQKKLSHGKKASISGQKESSQGTEAHQPMKMKNNGKGQESSLPPPGRPQVGADETHNAQKTESQRKEYNRPIAPKQSSSSDFFKKLHAARPPTNSDGPKFGETTAMKNPLAQAGLRQSNDHRKKQKAPQLPQKTFNSPVKSFQASSGSFMEPMTPKSSQWGQRADLNAFRKQPIESPSKDFFSGSAIDPLAYKANQWGTKNDFMAPSMHLGANNNVKMDPNSMEYIPPSKATDAIKDLLESFDGEDMEADGVTEVEGLTVKLLPHQTQGLKFLLKREAPNVANKGGLLCDDMGLGKTIQSIALILSNPLEKHTFSKDERYKNQSKTTLVIAPLALATQWASEIKEKAPGLRVCVHHGPKRTKSSTELTTYDVVVTTYQVVTSERDSKGPLNYVNWLRIIIDEAHTIKNRNSKSSLACDSLTGVCRWCLTGTPIQNNVDELYSLMRFLKISPYNNYQTWSSQITKLVNAGRAKVAMKRLHVVLAVVMIRRTKEVLGANGIKLPGRNIHREFVEFDANERSFYDKLEARVGSTIKDMLSEGGQQYMSALLLLLRLRQICDHIKLANGHIDDDDKEAVVSAVDKDASNSSGNPDELSDLLNQLSIEKENAALEGLGLKEESRIDNTGTSSKIRKLLEILTKEPSRKTIVFSQFTSMLDIVEPCLKQNNINFVRYDGKMRPQKRDESLDRLRNDKSVKVLLCSLKCGALGLNLTCANRVVLLDPWWNPMISEQAIDRVHRLGQTTDVDVYEFIVSKSVEERILALQDKKRELAKGVIEGGSAKKAFNNKLSVNDLLSLFN
jgi:transcription termination factor 2